MDIFFLLDQSIDLDVLYRMVRVSQIVRRGKYFFLKMRGHVLCTHTQIQRVMWRRFSTSSRQLVH